jgi:tRNA(Arg) A34 adenosine deaminase TadA
VVADEGGNVVIEQTNMALLPRRDPTAHAETLAAGLAGRCYEASRLKLFTLYSSAEPCAMCAGAVYWAGIGRVVYGLSEHDLLVLTGANRDNPTMDLPCRAVLSSGQREIEVIGPELCEEAREVIAGYWS